VIHPLTNDHSIDGHQHQPQTVLLQITHNVLLKLRNRQSASACGSPDELLSPLSEQSNTQNATSITLLWDRLAPAVP
ncbi:MAG: hypothetical protein VYB33_11210, partial [Pseudomonadota bacterium]|nr:hypothetical protein [Pseudomonadota bacterium]